MKKEIFCMALAIGWCVDHIAQSSRQIRQHAVIDSLDALCRANEEAAWHSAERAGDFVHQINILRVATNDMNMEIEEASDNLADAREAITNMQALLKDAQSRTDPSAVEVWNLIQRQKWDSYNQAGLDAYRRAHPPTYRH